MILCLSVCVCVCVCVADMENIRGYGNYSLLRKLFGFLKNIRVFEKYSRF